MTKSDMTTEAPIDLRKEEDIHTTTHPPTTTTTEDRMIEITEATDPHLETEIIITTKEIPETQKLWIMTNI
jgi:hypothetical protein